MKKELVIDYHASCKLTLKSIGVRIRCGNVSGAWNGSSSVSSLSSKMLSSQESELNVSGLWNLLIGIEMSTDGMEHACFPLWARSASGS